jgi:two-component system sensor histidine kinase KdpD
MRAGSFAAADGVKPGRFRHRVGAVAPVVIVVALGAVTLVVALLESGGLADASAVYLLAVVAVAVLAGTWPAVATAIGAFLLYDVLFIEPRYTFTVADPQEWLNLLLLLLIGIVVGQLAGRARDRAQAAVEGEREALTMFNMSFALASRPETVSALSVIASMLRDETRAQRVWIEVGDAIPADTLPTAERPPKSTVHTTLRRMPGDEPAEWVRVHAPARGKRSAAAPADMVYRVAITAGDRSFGSIWITRARTFGDPDHGETRILTVAADQIGGALERDRLQRDATTAEVSRRSDALKSALLDSVSHDLRTPLASIRAAAGTLMDAEVVWPEEQRREIAASIDREADWLNRLVTNLLDMSRIEAGELKPNLAVFDLRDLVEHAINRSMAGHERRSVTIDVPSDLPPVLVDEVYLGQVLANLLDNAAKYAGPDDPIAISTAVRGDGTIRVTVEDGGPGVPPEALPRLFEKFYRVPRPGEGSRRGTGIGLSVVRGLVEAMGGTVTARASDRGGLAVDLDLRAGAVQGEA